MMSSSGSSFPGVHVRRFGKCQASRNVTLRVVRGAMSTSTASEAIDASAAAAGRPSSTPSVLKSSQKSSSEPPQPRGTQLVRALTLPPAGVTSAIVPHASALGATPSESMNRPSTCVPERYVFRFFDSPTG